MTRPSGAPPLLCLWHLASLDAPSVAVAWALGFAWIAGVQLPPWVLLLLALVTWTVYVADRLLDARAGLRNGATHRLRERHRFHWRYRRILIPLALAAACAALGIVIALMPATARERNTLLAAAALVYFTRVHARPGLSTTRSLSRWLTFRFPLKELLVALLFTAACALPAVSRLPGANPAWPLSATAAFFALLAWINCHAIEQWESDSNPSPGPSTFHRAGLLGLLGLVLAALQFPSHPRPAALLATAAASALLLALLDLMRNRLTPVALRAAADLVLLAPLALLVR